MAHRKVPIGRTATFLIPEAKVELVHEEIAIFLTNNFDSFTFSDAVFSGYYLRKFEGKFREYRVSFLGKDRIPILDNFLEKLARELNEECIIETTGEDAWLIYPI